MTAPNHAPVDGTVRLVVVVPARNEAQRVAASLGSLVSQAVPLRAMFSDNASEDGTAEEAQRLADRLDLVVRTTSPLGPSEHFVSAGRWALAENPAVEHFALLAGDDTWDPAFATQALDALDRHPEADVVFPAFVWENPVEGTRRPLAPPGFEHGRRGARQLRALVLPDSRELANLVYGLYRRAAFITLLDAWERGGDAFASDYAAAWHVVGRHQVVACEGARGVRHVRAGADLLERVGLRRNSTAGTVGLVRLYLRLNIRINGLIATALRRVTDDGDAPSTLRVQVLRAPQWLAGALRQARGLTGARR